MKFVFKIFFILLFSWSFSSLKAQDQVQQQSQQNQGPLTKRQQYQKNRRDWKEKRKLEKEEQKNIRAHNKKIQTKKTRRRMRRDKRKAQLNNEHKREFFLIRWFRKN